MIKTALIHAGIAVVIQAALQFWLGWFAGGAVACAIFFGRELAQHEYKGGGPLKVSLLYGLINHWTLDSALDVLLPVIATGALWLLM